jgi:CheY-like chemotaxis protein
MSADTPSRVLIVDDEPLIIETLGRALRRRHKVTAVESGIEALALLDGGARFDVILCDLMMPELTGQELFGRLHATNREQAARMIFVTGGATTSAAEAFLVNAPNPPLYKPFNMNQVLVAIDGVVQVHSLLSGRFSTNRLRTIRS